MATPVGAGHTVRNSVVFSAAAANSSHWSNCNCTVQLAPCTCTAQLRLRAERSLANRAISQLSSGFLARGIYRSNFSLSAKSPRQRVKNHSNLSQHDRVLKEGMNYTRGSGYRYVCTATNMQCSKYSEY